MFLVICLPLMYIEATAKTQSTAMFYHAISRSETSTCHILSQAISYYSPQNWECQHLWYGEGHTITNTLFLLEIL